MNRGARDNTGPARPALFTAALGVALILPLGCGTQPGVGSAADCTVLVSVINVTPYDVTVLLSGILNDEVDTVERTVNPSQSMDVAFVRLDELVIGDPLEPTAAGVTIHVDGPAEEIPLTTISGHEFRCGDIIEIIVSIAEPEPFAVNVFVFTPP